MSIRSLLRKLTNSSPAAKPNATSSKDDPSGDYAVRQDWSSLDGEINYSSFIYFDVDRDGRYGVGDRPFGGIRVRLRRSGDVIASARTNNNGYANFKSSATNAKAPLHSPGVYEFVVSVPSGFTTTSGNQIQSAELKLRPGSLCGIASDEMLQPVGLAPNRIIGGRLPKNAQLSVKALDRLGGVAGEAEYFNQTAFRYPIPDDADEIEVSMADLTRRMPASPYPSDLGLFDPSRGALDPNRRTETINFDDVNPRGLRKIPSGYAGLNWFNLNAIARDFTKMGQGYVNGNTSGDYTAYVSGGYPALIYSDTPFDFIGVHLTAAWLNAEGDTGIIEVWRGDDLVAKDSVTLSALTPVFYNPCLPGITRIRLTSEHYWQIVLDDLVIAR